VDSHRLRFIKMFQPAFLSTASAHDVKQSWLGFINGLPSEELKEFLLKDVGEEQDASELAGRSFTIAHLGRVSLSNVSPDRITLLTCDDDKVITNDTAQELAGAYSGARHIRLPHGGHYPHVLNPSAYRDAISARLHG
jgi:pimeloyl-ACP methyl ester carboxylesterase